MSEHLVAVLHQIEGPGQAAGVSAADPHPAAALDLQVISAAPRRVRGSKPSDPTRQDEFQRAWR